MIPDAPTHRDRGTEQETAVGRALIVAPGMRITLALAALVTAGALVAGLVVAARPGSPDHARPAAASRGIARPSPSPAPVGYSFSKLDNVKDTTFNQLLGINNTGHITGYYGSGVNGHPNIGFILSPPYGQTQYQDISVPGSASTQVDGLNDNGVLVGFWSKQDNAVTGSNFGFYFQDGRFHTVTFPTTDNASPPVNQLLGVNDHGIAVGFYADKKGLNHGYLYNIATKKFSVVAVPGAASITPASINGAGAVAGFSIEPTGATEGFFLSPTGSVFMLNYPGATLTEPFAVNDSGEVAGFYQLGRGSTATDHGFIWTQGGGFTTVDDPAGSDTVISGLNDAGDLVGSYVDSAGDTNGLLATLPTP